MRQPARRTHERTARFQQFDDRLVGVEDPFALVFRQPFGEFARFADRRINFEAVLHARLIVLTPVARGGVDRARPVLCRDVVGEHAGDLAVEKRVPHSDVFEFGAGNASQDRGCF